MYLNLSYKSLGSFFVHGCATRIKWIIDNIEEKRLISREVFSTSNITSIKNQKLKEFVGPKVNLVSSFYFSSLVGLWLTYHQIYLKVLDQYRDLISSLLLSLCVLASFFSKNFFSEVEFEVYSLSSIALVLYYSTLSKTIEWFYEGGMSAFTKPFNFLSFIFIFRLLMFLFWQNFLLNHNLENYLKNMLRMVTFSIYIVYEFNYHTFFVFYIFIFSVMFSYVLQATNVEL